MGAFPAALEELIDQFASLPGIGYKSAQRLAFHILSLPDSEARAFADAVQAGRTAVIECIIDKEEFVLPMVPSGGTVDNIITAAP